MHRSDVVEVSRRRETIMVSNFVVRLEGLPFRVSKEELVEFFADCKIPGGTDGIHLVEDNSIRYGPELSFQGKSFSLFSFLSLSLDHEPRWSRFWSWLR